MKNFNKIIAVFLLLESLTLAKPVWALSDQMSLTGVVFNSDGELLTGTQNVTFRLYDADDAEASIWEETQSVEFSNGIYAVLLGSATSFDSDLFSKDSLFLGIQIEGDDEMEPRITLSSVPWAMEADVANMALSLAQDIVTAENISPGSIESSAIATGAIGASELASTGVTSGTYTNATITIDGDGRVTSASSGSGGALGDITSVIAGPGLAGGGASGDVVLFLAAGGITNAMLGGSVVTANKIATDAVESAAIKTDAVGSDEIAADAVGSSEIAADAVGTSEIATDGIGSAEIAADAVGTSEIATDGVASAEIAADAVGTSEIADNTVDANDLAATLTFGDSDFIDLSAVTASSTTEGLKLPQAADVTASTAEGQISWDSNDDQLRAGTGSAAIVIGGFLFNGTDTGGRSASYTIGSVGGEEQVAAMKMICSNLFFQVDNSPGSGGDAASDTWTATLQDDGVNTSLTCSITNASTSCSDTTNNTGTIAAGSMIQLDVVETSTVAGNGGSSWSMICYPAP